MSGLLGRLRRWWSGPSEFVEALHERNVEVTEAFDSMVASAPTGAYFRTLAHAVDETPVGFGQRVDFKGLVCELAKLEQRIADLEAGREVVA